MSIWDGIYNKITLLLHIKSIGLDDRQVVSHQDFLYIEKDVEGRCRMFYFKTFPPHCTPLLLLNWLIFLDPDETQVPYRCGHFLMETKCVNIHGTVTCSYEGRIYNSGMKMWIICECQLQVHVHCLSANCLLVDQIVNPLMVSQSAISGLALS